MIAIGACDCGPRGPLFSWTQCMPECLRMPQIDRLTVLRFVGKIFRGEYLFNSLTVWHAQTENIKTATKVRVEPYMDMHKSFNETLKSV